MKKKIKEILYSHSCVVTMGLVLVPLLSFILITLSPESPLYTSISRIAWVHGQWLATCIWGLIVLGVIAWLTYRLFMSGPLKEKQKRRLFAFEICNIILVFIGCLVFPAKNSPEIITLVNYIHDYLTAGAWALYVSGLVIYSFSLRKVAPFLGKAGVSIMTFIILSSIFFLSHVIDSASYVGASAVSEVYIINSLLIYLVVMYLLQVYHARLLVAGGEPVRMKDRD